MKILHVGWGYWPFRYGGLMNYVEDLMDAQVASGDQVTYFCAGRHFPGLRQDRLHRWSRRGILIREIQNSSLAFAGATLTPETDLHHEPSERHFKAVLEEICPDVVHIQELLGLPSSIIDLARAAGIPVMATGHDYLPLCPTAKLYDVDDRLCLRDDVGDQCARCCAAAAEGQHFLRMWTLAYELREHLPGDLGDRMMGAAARHAKTLRKLAAGRRQPIAGPATAREAGDRPAADEHSPASPRRYQDRRETNVDRLSRLDLMVVPSRRGKELYQRLGVPADRLRVMQLTLDHFTKLRPRVMHEPPELVHFATLNGCSSIEKGREVIFNALERLHEAGLQDRFKLTVFGSASTDTQSRLAHFPGAHYAGGYDRVLLDQRLASVDVGIVPSVWEESYGFVGIELLAVGIPVIGNRRGGIADYTLEGETGWLNADASGEGLAAIMTNLIRNPSQVLEMHRSVASREELIRTMPDHAREVSGVYRELIAAKRV